jgi:hypothetical protein
VAQLEPSLCSFSEPLTRNALIASCKWDDDIPQTIAHYATSYSRVAFHHIPRNQILEPNPSFDRASLARERRAHA